jgi:thimet oligopeptidase
MENWAKETAALQLFARHYQTNEPIPTELCQIMKDKESF